MLKAQALFAAGQLGTLFYGEAEYLHHTESLCFTPDGRSLYRRRGAAGVGSRATGCAWLELAVLRSEKGCLFKLMNAFCNAHPGGHYLSCYGDKSSFETARGTRARFVANYWSRADAPREMAEDTCAYPPLPDYVKYMGGHAGPAVGIIDDFVQAIFDGTTAPIGPILSAHMHLPGICALQSIQTGQRVEIPDPRAWID